MLKNGKMFLITRLLYLTEDFQIVINLFLQCLLVTLTPMLGVMLQAVLLEWLMVVRPRRKD